MLCENDEIFSMVLKEAEIGIREDKRRLKAKLNMQIGDAAKELSSGLKKTIIDCVEDEISEHLQDTICSILSCRYSAIGKDDDGLLYVYWKKSGKSMVNIPIYSLQEDINFDELLDERFKLESVKDLKITLENSLKYVNKCIEKLESLGDEG